jgi:hypothetical protein
MRSGNTAALTVPLAQLPHARFSRRVTCTKIPCRLHVQLLAFVVADHRALAAALRAALPGTLDHSFHARQILGQALPAWMRFALALADRLAAHFGFHFLARHARLFFGQQLQLQIAQRLAVRPQETNALPPQPFFQYLNLQVRPLQLAFQHCDVQLGMGGVHGEVLS